MQSVGWQGSEQLKKGHIECQLLSAWVWSSRRARECDMDQPRTLPVSFARAHQSRRFAADPELRVFQDGGMRTEAKELSFGIQEMHKYTSHAAAVAGAWIQEETRSMDQSRNHGVVSCSESSDPLSTASGDGAVGASYGADRTVAVSSLRSSYSSQH